MKRAIKILIMTAIIALTASGCGNDVKDTSTKTEKITESLESISDNSETAENSSDNPEKEDIIWLDANSVVAGTIIIETSMYFYEGTNPPILIHDIVKDDGGFGTHLIETHPALEGMEYILEFGTNQAILNVFCLQPNTNPVTIGCNGQKKKISDWGFESWEDILAHYELDEL